MTNVPPKEIRALSVVQRWPVTRTIQTQSVAEHSFYVAIYAKWLCELMNLDSEEQSAALEYALEHDMKEIVTGDIPTPFKDKSMYIDKSGEMFNELTGGYEIARMIRSETKSIVKLADMLEAWCFLAQEDSLGNLDISQIQINLCRKIKKFMREHFEQYIIDIDNFMKQHTYQPRTM